jgi:transposase
MLNVRSGLSVYVSLEPMDMRKSINGLVLWVTEELKRPIQTGDLFVFVGRSKDKMKIVYWDKNGFVLYYKRLEQHKFLLPKPDDIGQGFLMVTEEQLQGLLVGLNNLYIDYPLPPPYEEFI